MKWCGADQPVQFGPALPKENAMIQFIKLTAFAIGASLAGLTFGTALAIIILHNFR